jgi:hypothetical protein
LYVALGLAFVPSILAPGTYLHLVRRAVLALPLVPLFGVLLPLSIDYGLRRHVRGIRAQEVSRGLVWFASFGLVSFLAWRGFVGYFDVLLHQPAVAHHFNVDVVRLVDDMNESGQPDATYAILLNHRRPSFYERYVIDFLYEGKADYIYLRDDEATALLELAPHFAQKDELRLVRLSRIEKTGVDSKGYVDYLLERWGRYVTEQVTPYYKIETYQRDPTPNLVVDSPLTPMSTYFDDKWQLVGANYGDASNITSTARQVPAGEQLWVDLLWEKSSPDTEDYQVAVWLEDATGHHLSGLDKLLLSNDQQRASAHWDIGQLEHSYHLLPIPTSALPGEYTLKTAIYEATTYQRLLPQQPGVGADLALSLGNVFVQPPQQALEDTLPANMLLIDKKVGLGLYLSGLEKSHSEPLRPGDPLWVALFWRAEKEIRPDYLLALHFVSDQEERPLFSAETIGGEAYPTSQWPTDHQLKQWFGGYLPADLQGGTYRLVAEVQADNSEWATRLDLLTVQVQTRPRQFDLAAVQHSLSIALDDGITLLGFETNARPFHAGDTVTLSLYWQADHSVDTSYISFAHIIDGTGRIVTQQDQIPQQGRAPTTGWMPGEIVTDVKMVLLPSEMAEGNYGVEVGMYDPGTGYRLTVFGQSTDTIWLGQFTVQQSPPELK